MPFMRESHPACLGRSDKLRSVATILLSTLFLLLAVSVEAQTSKCADLFASLFSKVTTRTIGGRTMSLSEHQWSKLDRVSSQVGGLRRDGVVVYAPIKNSLSVVNFRFESKRSGKVLQEIVGDGQLSPKEFEELLGMAQEPSNNLARETLASALLIGTDRIDDGKLVFFTDLSFDGALPVSFNRRNGLALGSRDLGAALSNYFKAATYRPQPNQFTAFVGYPETQAEYDVVFKNTRSASLSVWQEQSQAFKKVAEEHGVATYSGKSLQKFKTKGDLLREFEQSDGIVFLVAHADGCHVRLPSGETIDLVPEDIARLKLAKSPFVVARICNGQDNGYAQAFLTAGARGVWINRGVISPKAATEEIAAFLGFLSKGKSVREAIIEVETSSEAMGAARALFTRIWGLLATRGG